MSKTPGFGQGTEMPARKKQGAIAIDIMKPGNGTPWEDRGATGAIVAYFKTVTKSLTSPALLMDHIRRPETTADAKVFAITSGAMWVLGIIGWNVYWYYVILPKSEVYGIPLEGAMYYWITLLIEVALACGALYLWLTVGPRLYRSLGGTELKQVTPSLIFNCFAYALGPSLLALIPFFGWGLAAVWIIFNLIIMGKRRFYMKGSSAIINALMLGICAVAIVVVFCLVARWLWIDKLEMGGLEHVVHAAPPTPHAQ